ncbi:enoyl-CoA hydratase/isomerase family protein [Tessaracoccus caeni]|uniref:enoyl-CoA hydratase/isomerase family protein n=1 Tax=Tessaracoccus caeni TaxID=3031239 RepID=UPI0023DA853A|nr:enoyl-CoA hydratase-related protein [Tessaracoccus caeni]MDF1486917.1 enoyl-CoA hydratase-related protein [Tessaracoccus caeni]
MEYQQIRLDVDDQIARVTLNSPDRMNAVGLEMARELREVFGRLAADPDVRVVVLNGEGRAFCAGGDVASFGDALDRDSGELGELVEVLAEVSVMLRTMPQPVISSVHRSVAGAGMGLALHADFCLAAEGTFFVTAFGGVGLAGDTGVAYVVARRLGHVKAAELLMTGRVLSADEAAGVGLITRVVPAEQLEEATRELAERLKAGPRGAYAAMKRQIWAAEYGGYEAFLAVERETQVACGSSAEFGEGVRAFMERRRPDFS